MADEKHESWAIKTTLSTPIEVKDKSSGEILRTISELKFRAPTGGDFIDIGNPVIMDVFADVPGSTLKFDNKILAAMIARLTNETPWVVRQMSPSDISYCGYQLSSFFIPPL